MPTVLRVGPYRFFFYSSEGAEPAHIHVERDKHRAKWWLDPVRLASSSGFGSHELVRIRSIVVEHEATMLGTWNEFFRH
ncbi:MAG TPA: DUF4160 domain-containing protein [Candidatus Polarisedimenticolia bacterium]|nr:DUF4160 domain-containing protein [Candidatus Polarisedimenticolia bacterium]